MRRSLPNHGSAMLALLIAGYLTVGAVLLCLPAVRVVVWSSVTRTDWTGQPAWKRRVFIAVILAVAALGWPFFLRSWLAVHEQLIAAAHAEAVRQD